MPFINYVPMRQLDAGVGGYAFLGHPGRPVFPFTQGVMQKRQMNLVATSAQVYHAQTFNTIPSLPGVVTGGSRLQPLSTYDQITRNYKIPT